MLENPDLDPLQLSQLPETSRAEDLVEIADQNEILAAHHSLDAQLRHWKDGSLISARDWIEEIYQEVWPIAKKQGFSCFLSPVKRLLREGCTAQQWLRLSEQGHDPRFIMQQAIQEMADQEKEFEDQICQPLVA
jgi:predicted glutamate--cysteine ligase